MGVEDGAVVCAEEGDVEVLCVVVEGGVVEGP